MPKSPKASTPMKGKTEGVAAVTPEKLDATLAWLRRHRQAPHKWLVECSMLPRVGLSTL